MKVSELLDTIYDEILQAERNNYAVKVVIDKVGVFDIKDIDISIDSDYNEVYINAVEEKGNE